MRRPWQHGFGTVAPQLAVQVQLVGPTPLLADAVVGNADEVEGRDGHHGPDLSHKRSFLKQSRAGPFPGGSSGASPSAGKTPATVTRGARWLKRSIDVVPMRVRAAHRGAARTGDGC